MLFTTIFLLLLQSINFLLVFWILGNFRKLSNIVNIKVVLLIYKLPYCININLHKVTMFDASSVKSCSNDYPFQKQFQPSTIWSIILTDSESAHVQCLWPLLAIPQTKFVHLFFQGNSWWLKRYATVIFQILLQNFIKRYTYTFLYTFFADIRLCHWELF